MRRKIKVARNNTENYSQKKNNETWGKKNANTYCKIYVQIESTKKEICIDVERRQKKNTSASENTERI